jgi:hypothetical protein
MVEKYEIALATTDDLDAVLDLQERNLPQLPGREGVLFIRCDNDASLRSHARMGMRQVAKFDHDGARFAVLSYVG